MKCSNLFCPFFVLALISIFSPIDLDGQIYKFERLDFRKYVKEGPLMNGEELKGYYTCYENETADNKTKGYKFTVLDIDLNLLGSDKFALPKDVVLLQVALLNDKIVAKFGDPKKDLFIYRVYNSKAEFLFDKEREVDKWEFKSVGGAKIFTAPITSSIFPLSDGSFLEFCTRSKRSKVWYEIRSVSDDLSQERWSITSDPDERFSTYAAYLGGNEDILLILTSKTEIFEKIRGVSMYLLALNPESGKKIFEKKITDDKHEYLPTKAFIKDDGSQEITLMGQCVEREKKSLHNTFRKAEEIKDKCFFSITYDGQGKEIGRTVVNWQKAIEKLPNSIGEIDRFFAHEFFTNPEGEITIIAENHSGSFHEDVTRTDVIPKALVVFRLSSTMELLEAIKIEKEGYHKFFHSYPFYSINEGMVIKAGWGFDYLFTQFQKGGDSFIVAYLYFKVPEGEKRKRYYLGLNTFVDGEFLKKEIDLNASSPDGLSRILPGKPGYFAVFDYDEKTQKLDAHIERIRE